MEDVTSKIIAFEMGELKVQELQKKAVCPFCECDYLKCNCPNPQKVMTLNESDIIELFELVGDDEK